MLTLPPGSQVLLPAVKTRGPSNTSRKLTRAGLGVPPNIEKLGAEGSSRQDSIWPRKHSRPTGGTRGLAWGPGEARLPP